MVMAEPTWGRKVVDTVIVSRGKYMLDLSLKDNAFYIDVITRHV